MVLVLVLKKEDTMLLLLSRLERRDLDIKEIRTLLYLIYTLLIYLSASNCFYLLLFQFCSLNWMYCQHSRIYHYV